jgi:acetoin utilization deacetylase AcuC-like enzyme
LPIYLDTVFSAHHITGYVNNVAVAVSAYQSLPQTSLPSSVTTSTSSLSKVAILDLDFHHGNGTQELLYSEPSVLYVSIHGEDEFPYYTGHVEETGLGDGEGFNLNLPLPTGSPIETYMGALEKAVARIKDFGAGLVVVSLGFDTFFSDPLGGFKIGTEDYEVIGRKARECAGDGAKGLVVLEGGYVIEKLGENLVSWLRGWESGRHGMKNS